MLKYDYTIRSFLKLFFSINFLYKAVLIISRLGLIPAKIYAGFPINRDVDIYIGDRSLKYHLEKGDEVGMSIHWSGIMFESETVEVFLDLIKKADYFVDIGANTGIFSLISVLSNDKCKVLSFEPVHESYKALVYNINVNNFEKNIEPYEKVVSNIDGQVEFHEPCNALYPTSASLDLKGFRGCKGSIVKVDSITIDNFLSAVTIGRVKNILFKIDVEGFEQRVLEGMRRTIEKHKPIIILECLSDGPAVEVTNILKKFGYVFYHLTNKGKIKRDKIIPDQSERYKNWLCVGGE